MAVEAQPASGMDPHDAALVRLGKVIGLEQAMSDQVLITGKLTETMQPGMPLPPPEAMSACIKSAGVNELFMADWVRIHKKRIPANEANELASFFESANLPRWLTEVRCLATGNGSPECASRLRPTADDAHQMAKLFQSAQWVRLMKIQEATQAEWESANAAGAWVDALSRCARGGRR